LFPNVRDHRWLPVARPMHSERNESASGVQRVAIRCIALFCVVKSELCDLKILCSNSVNHTMLIRDTARPEPRKGVLQRFRFPDPIIMASHSVLDQFVDSSDHFFVRLQPVLVIFPSFGRENKIHASTRSLTLFLTVFPEFRLSIDASKRFALAGDRSR